MSLGELLKQRFMENLNPEGRQSKEWIGCSHDDLERLKKAQKVEYLPDIYVDVMSVMGCSGVQYVLGMSFTFDDLLGELKNMLLEEAEYTNYPLPSDIFVLATHEYHQFYFFRTQPRDPDPVVYGFNGVKMIQADQSLQAFFKGALDDVIVAKRYTPAEGRKIEASFPHVKYDPESNEFVVKTTTNNEIE